MTVKLIVAVDAGNAIGWADGRLPWRIPDDLKRFKELTTGKTVLMGRKTFESLNRPEGLPNRQNIVITSSRPSTFDSGSSVNYFSDGREPVKSFIQVHQACLGCVPEDLWVIGGAQVYRTALESGLVDEIHLTAVGQTSGADILFPFDLSDLTNFNKSQEAIGVQWTLDSQEKFSDKPIPFSFITLKKAS